MSLYWKIGLVIASAAAFCCHEITREDDRKTRMFLAAVGVITLGVGAAWVTRTGVAALPDPRTVAAAAVPDPGCRLPSRCARLRLGLLW